MRCYLCNNIAEYSCNCANPSVFICEDHLKYHIEDKSVKHTFGNFEINEIKLLIELKQKLLNLKEEIALKSNNIIKAINERASQSLILINEFSNILYENYIEKNSNQEFLKEILIVINGKIDDARLRKHILRNSVQELDKKRK